MLYFLKKGHARRCSTNATAVLLSEFNRKHEEKLLVVRKLKYQAKFCCCQFLNLVNMTQLWRYRSVYSGATWCMCYIKLHIVLSYIFTELIFRIHNDALSNAKVPCS
jgi:hypothetical protein